MAELDIRETVRQRYAQAARSTGDCCSPADGSGAFGESLYGDAVGEVPAAALSASLGCGMPTAVADLRDGETVLDLGSGAGADVLLSARRVGPAGRAIGLDMTDEMLELGRATRVNPASRTSTSSRATSSRCRCATQASTWSSRTA